MKIPGGDIRVITDYLIYIEDEDGITFDLDELEKILRRIGIKTRRVILRDKHDNFDEMIFVNGRFSRFEQLFDDDPMLERILYYVDLLEEKHNVHPSSRYNSVWDMPFGQH